MKNLIQISVSLSLIAFCFSASNCAKADSTSKAKRAMDKARMEQNLKLMMGRNTNSMWEDSARAPSDFPVKLFRGNQTVFMRMDEVEAGMSADSKRYGRHLTLRTRDPAPAVIQFYKTSLPAAGLKINEKLSNTTTNMNSIYAESDKMTVMVVAVPQDDAGGPACQFQVNVSFPPEKKK